MLPSEPKLVKIHNNVWIASGVTFFTHDVINHVFEYLDGVSYESHNYCIEIFDNVFIGGNTTIAGNISIGPNAIIAAGAVVTEDVPEDVIIAGNPGKIDGAFDELHKQRAELHGNKPFFKVECDYAVGDWGRFFWWWWGIG